MTDEAYMQIALELARQAYEINEVPVGAIVVKKSTGKIIGKGYNRREIDKNPLAHAEIAAIKQAAETLGGWRLLDCDIYVTLEPCPMCCGAIINSRIERVIFGAFDSKSGSVESIINMFDLPFNHKPKIVSGIMQKECSEILSDFFTELRKRLKNKKS
ncbi:MULTISPECIES: tRNA adenosine(34) deaminase TadA [Porcipelethomonas]|jgi:tRNA(adenine34) deaminase|uniref:tRNA adenosine(34) deaminase TadA n=1 Tax=Porcipelethomonas TaxID=2981643 RepID=UPI000821C602|nr:tRNA adenosine(34) deaminase TadA [Porcipelethomonas ammoniilytica]MBS1325126.1 nucleoside deaminase [Oscillospiraceae bacterium]MBS6315453.1 tRNA adenosine(34) deaminase TadA [Ruminococcus sp.]OLA70027.1 MAG: tRNA-specific adenosine deaminase [Ruminococcus sp. 37_24]SCI57490.1 tRNA-specific adenosine deaminase [uncultured Ruminococcus sp.]MCU6718644.1 tRNA adenosine(34) deaminase TadA [Porcipelethomonas ammoniilytica]